MDEYSRNYTRFVPLLKWTGSFVAKEPADMPCTSDNLASARA